MGKQLVNRTLPVVIEEIENILEAYPEYPYQQAFSQPTLRQNLIAYVLSRVPNQYIVVEEIQFSLKQIVLPHYSSKRLLDIEYWIHLGIRDVLQVHNQIKWYNSAAQNALN